MAAGVVVIGRNVAADFGVSVKLTGWIRIIIPVNRIARGGIIASHIIVEIRMPVNKYVIHLKAVAGHIRRVRSISYSQRV